MYSYEIGLTQIGLTNLAALDPPVAAPKHHWQGYSTFVIRGDGIKKGVGYPVAKWHWGFLTKDQRDALRAFVSEASSTLFITTRIEDDSYASFECVCAWPEEEEKDTGRRMDFTLEFTHLVEVT